MGHLPGMPASAVLGVGSQVDNQVVEGSLDVEGSLAVEDILAGDMAAVEQGHLQGTACLLLVEVGSLVAGGNLGNLVEEGTPFLVRVPYVSVSLK